MSISISWERHPFVLVPIMVSFRLGLPNCSSVTLPWIVKIPFVTSVVVNNPSGIPLTEGISLFTYPMFTGMISVPIHTVCSFDKLELNSVSSAFALIVIVPLSSGLTHPLLLSALMENSNSSSSDTFTFGVPEIVNFETLLGSTGS